MKLRESGRAPPRPMLPRLWKQGLGPSPPHPPLCLARQEGVIVCVYTRELHGALEKLGPSAELTLKLQGKKRARGEPFKPNQAASLHVDVCLCLYVCLYVLVDSQLKGKMICSNIHIYIYIHICYPPRPHAPTSSYLYRKIATKNRLSWAGREATNTFQVSGP